jgi:hypothetical protein
MPYAVALHADGKIVVGGGLSGGSRIVRYTVHGQLDPSFGSGGHADLADYMVTGVGVQPNGRIVAAGNRYGGQVDVVLSRLLPTGEVD